MNKYDLQLLLIDMNGMRNLATKWLAETPCEKDAVNHLRFSFLVSDLNIAIKKIEENVQVTA